MLKISLLGCSVRCTITAAHSGPPDLSEHKTHTLLPFSCKTDVNIVLCCDFDVRANANDFSMNRVSSEWRRCVFFSTPFCSTSLPHSIAIIVSTFQLLWKLDCGFAKPNRWSNRHSNWPLFRFRSDDKYDLPPNVCRWTCYSTKWTLCHLNEMPIGYFIVKSFGTIRVNCESIQTGNHMMPSAVSRIPFHTCMWVMVVGWPVE